MGVMGGAALPSGSLEPNFVARKISARRPCGGEPAAKHLFTYNTNWK